MTHPEVRTPRRVCLVVLGMHRSGTSAVTRVLSLLGASLPRDLMPPQEDNPSGFWEPLELKQLHERMLAEGASHWDDWRAFDPAVLGAERLAFYRKEIVRLLDEQYGDSPLMVLKEPRICRFVSLYEESFATLGVEPRFILTHRNPLAVIASLARRNGMTEGFAGLLWLRHVLEAEKATRRQRRVFLSYEDLLGDWRGTVERIGRALEARWPRCVDQAAEEIDAYVSPNLRHHQSTFADLQAKGHIPAWIKESYAALQTLEAAGAGEAAALATLKRVHREFEAAEPIFGAATFPELAMREGRLRDELRRVGGELSGRSVELRELTAEATSLKAEQARVVGELGERERQLSEAAGELSRRSVELRELTAEAESLKAGHARVVGELGERERQLSEAAAEKADLANRVASLQENVAASDAAAAELRHRIDAIYRSRSWRLLAPIRAVFTALRQLRLYFGCPVTAHSSSEPQAAVADGGSLFGLAWPSPHPLPPGRYRLKLERPADGKDVSSARICADSGAGYAESGGIDLLLRRTRTGKLAASLTLSQGAVGLRFDAGVLPGEITLGRMRIRRLSRFERYGRSAAGAAARRRKDPIAGLRAAAGASRTLRTGGVRALAAALRAEESRELNDRGPSTQWHRPPGEAKIADDAEEAYAELSRQIAERRLAAAPKPLPAGMIRLQGRDLRAHARRLKFAHASAPEVSIVIPVHDNLWLTLECLTSILERTEGVPYEVVVADDASSDETRDVLSLIPNIVIVENAENLGFLRTCNRAVDHARGEYIVLLNNDVQVTDGWLTSLLETFTRQDGVGAVGPKVLYPDGRLQEAGAVINTDGSVGLVGLTDDPDRPRYNYTRDVDHISAVCLMFRKDLFLDLGRFDERLAPAYYEDVDLCLRLRERGRRIVYNPAAVIVHHLSASADDVQTANKLECVTRNRQRILEMWLEHIEALNRVRTIAFYLPQFHPIPENDRWWGKGFTEWTNVTRARPSFEGHYQPRLPSDLGYYDLRVGAVLEEQAALARRYGIHGFCFYYYWFNGRRLLDLPIERMLTTGQPDIPFCLCWANENWTRRWDGLEQEILIAQHHSDGDDEAVIRDLIRYFQHPNYIRINGRPLFLVYRVDRFPDMKRTAAHWRSVARAAGIDDIYLASVEAFEMASEVRPPSTYGFDAAVEFPPHGSWNAAATSVPGQLLNPNFAGRVSEYRDLVLRHVRTSLPGYVRFRTVMPSWDNTARRRDHAFIVHRASPGAFQAWLETAIEDTREQYCGDERIVFLNAWNEWAEGNYLEPDQRFGHGYLEAIHNALERTLLRNARGA